MSAVFHPGHPMHVPPPHHLHHHTTTSGHHHHNSTNNIIGGGGGGGVESNGGHPPGFMLDDGSNVVGGVGYPHDGMTPPGMVWDPSLQGDGGGKFRLKRRRRCGQCAPCQVKENCNKCQYCMRKDVLKQACIYRKCVYLRKPVPRFRQDAQTPNNDPSSPTNGVPGGGPVNKSASPTRKPNSNNNTTTTNNNINGGVAAVTPALSNCSTNSNGSSHNNSTGNSSNNNNNSSTTNQMGGGAANGGSSSSSSGSSSNNNNSNSASNNGISSSMAGLHHSTTSVPGTTELSSCRLNQSPFGANPPSANGVILDPLRHRTMMDAHYQHHRAPGGPPFFDPMAAQLPATGSPHHHHHHQHDLTPAAAAAAAVAAAAAAGNSMSPHHPVSHLNAHSQATKMVSPSSTSVATSREAAAAATTYFPHPAESWGSAVPYAAFPRAPSWAASAYGFNQHSSPFASSFTPSSFPPSPFPGSSCRLSLPDSSSSSSASRYGHAATTTPQHPFHHSMPGISGFSTGDALSHAQYPHHPAHHHAHSNMRSSFYPPAPPTGHHLGSSSTLSSFPGLGPHSFGPSPYHPHPHSHMYPGSFYSSLRAATEPQIYHVQVLPSQNPFKLLLQQTCDFLDSLNCDKSELKPFHKDFTSAFSEPDTWDTPLAKYVPQICNTLNDQTASPSPDKNQTQRNPCSRQSSEDSASETPEKDQCFLHRNSELAASDNKSCSKECSIKSPSSSNIPHTTSIRNENSNEDSTPSSPQSGLFYCSQNMDYLGGSRMNPDRENWHVDSQDAIKDFGTGNEKDQDPSVDQKGDATLSMELDKRFNL